MKLFLLSVLLLGCNGRLIPLGSGLKYSRECLLDYKYCGYTKSCIPFNDSCTFSRPILKKLDIENQFKTKVYEIEI